jgi:hypothetical protein
MGACTSKETDSEKNESSRIDRELKEVSSVSGRVRGWWVGDWYCTSRWEYHTGGRAP